MCLAGQVIFHVGHIFICTAVYRYFRGLKSIGWARGNFTGPVKFWKNVPSMHINLNAYGAQEVQLLLEIYFTSFQP